jgi:hypothetical protein
MFAVFRTTWWDRIDIEVSHDNGRRIIPSVKPKESLWIRVRTDPETGKIDIEYLPWDGKPPPFQSWM